jgi:hypothetical protein
MCRFKGVGGPHHDEIQAMYTSYNGMTSKTCNVNPWILFLLENIIKFRERSCIPSSEEYKAEN